MWTLALSGGPSDCEAQVLSPVYTGYIPQSECRSKSSSVFQKLHIPGPHPPIPLAWSRVCEFAFLMSIPEVLGAGGS